MRIVCIWRAIVENEKYTKVMEVSVSVNSVVVCRILLKVGAVLVTWHLSRRQPTQREDNEA